MPLYDKLGLVAPTGAPTFRGIAPAATAFKNVAIDGKTVAMIDAKAEKARRWKARIDENVAVYLDAWSDIEKGILPFAKKVDAAMKLTPAQVKADIHKHVSSRSRHLGRDALLEQDNTGTAKIVQQLLGVLLKDGREQIDVAGQAVLAHATQVEADELKAKIAELKGAFEKVFKVAEILMDPKEAALKVVSLATDLAIDASSLKKRADELDALAKQRQTAALDAAVDRARDYCTNLDTVIGDLSKRLAKTANHQAQLSGEAEGAYDNDANDDKTKGKPKFAFDGISKGVRIADGSLQLLQKTAGELRDAMVAVSDYGHFLHSHGPAAAPAREDKLMLQLDADYQHELAIVQKRIDDALVESPRLMKEMRTMLTDVEAKIAKASERFDKWTEFYAMSQDALYTAPEPNAKYQ